MGQSPDFRSTDAQSTRYYQGRIETHQATLAGLNREREAIRELPLLQRLRLGNLARRVDLYVRTGKQKDLIGEYQDRLDELSD